MDNTDNRALWRRVGMGLDWLAVGFFALFAVVFGVSPLGGCCLLLAIASQPIGITGGLWHKLGRWWHLKKAAIIFCVFVAVVVTVPMPDTSDATAPVETPEQVSATVTPTQEPVTTPTREPERVAATLEPTQEPQQSISVWVVEDGSKYHSTPKCSTLNRSSPVEITLDDAQAQGLEPCKVCH